MPVSRDEYDRQVLQAIASGEPLTQRAISGRLGVALGLANLVIGRLVDRGYIEVSRISPRQFRYVMTMTGRQELARARRRSLEQTVRRYSETREQIRGTLAALSACCEVTEGGKRVLFYGAGDLAEIAYVSVHATDLQLIGIVDDRRRDTFFDLTIVGPEHLFGRTLGGVTYSRVIVTSDATVDTVKARLAEREVPEECICWL